MKIILDYDSTLVKTHYAVLELYRQETKDYGTEINDENLVWNMRDICRYWTQEQVDDIFTNPKLFDYMELFEDAEDVLNKLHDEEDYLEICSMHKKQGIENKRRWIENNLKMIDEITILPLDNGLVKFDKSSVKGDIIIDDRIDAILSSPCKYKIIYGTYSWNKDFYARCIPNCYRANNWLEVYDIIRQIKLIEKDEELIW